jgi:hypothetical protein
LPRLGKVDREPLKIGEFAVSESSLVCSAKNYPRNFACFNGLLPTRGTKTPTVAGLQTLEADFRHRGGQVVPARLREREKLPGHHSADGMASEVLLAADGMASEVLLASVAAAVAIEACHGLKRTDFQRLTEHVASRNWSPFALATVGSEHGLGLMAAGAGAEVYDTEGEA